MPDSFSFEEQAKRLYGLGELEREARCMRFIVRQTERGENLHADLVELARDCLGRYDRIPMRGHEAPGVVPLRCTPDNTVSHAA